MYSLHILFISFKQNQGFVCHSSAFCFHFYKDVFIWKETFPEEYGLNLCQNSNIVNSDAKLLYYDTVVGSVVFTQQRRFDILHCLQNTEEKTMRKSVE